MLSNMHYAMAGKIINDVWAADGDKESRLVYSVFVEFFIADDLNFSAKEHLQPYLSRTGYETNC